MGVKNLYRISFKKYLFQRILKSIKKNKIRVLTDLHSADTLYWMMKRAVLFTIMFLSPAWASSYGIPADAQFRIEAQVLDTYEWSVDEGRNKDKYNLEKVRMGFQIMVISESAGLSHVVQNENGEKKISTFERSMTVFPNDEVLFELPPIFKPVEFDKDSPLYQDPDEIPLREVFARSRLSEDEERLSVYFEENKKKGVLVGMLYSYDVILPLHNINPQISSSDYQCRIRNSKLLCSIDYVFNMDLQELLDNVPESEEFYRKLVRPFSDRGAAS